MRPPQNHELNGKHRAGRCAPWTMSVILHVADRHGGQVAAGFYSIIPIAAYSYLDYIPVLLVQKLLLTHSSSLVLPMLIAQVSMSPPDLHFAKVKPFSYSRTTVLASVSVTALVLIRAGLLCGRRRRSIGLTLNFGGWFGYCWLHGLGRLCHTISGRR